MSPKIIKLDGYNYFDWIKEAKAALLSKKVWRVAIGEIKKPEDNSSEKFLDWCEKDEVAQGVITQLVNPSIYDDIRDLDTAAEMWEKLKSYEKKTLLNRCTLKKALWNTSMKPKQDVQTHVQNLKKIATKLKGMGAAVSDEDLIGAIITSVSSEFSEVITAINVNFVNNSSSSDAVGAKEGDNNNATPSEEKDVFGELTVDSLLAKLVAHQERIRGKNIARATNDGEEDAGQANMANRPRSKMLELQQIWTCPLRV